MIDLECVREAGPGDEVAGIRPRWVATPASTQETAAVLRAAAERDLAVVPRGSGTRLGWGRSPSRCHLILDSTHMNRVVEHEAGDLVARIQSGATFSSVGEVLARAGQRISLDVPPASTIGGAIADALAGPLRFRYGSPRDLLIGITVVRADGVVARSGGKVVKNVAGYDLGKLFSGSRGTLGVITEAAFRLHPIPEAREWVVATLDSRGSMTPHPPPRPTPPPSRGVDESSTAYAQLQAMVAAAANSALVPSAVEMFRPEPGAPVQVGVLLEGSATGVASRAEKMAGLLGDGARRDAWRVSSQGTVVRVAFWVSALARVLAAVDAAAAEAGVRSAVGGSAGAGVLDVWFDGDPGPFVTALRSRLDPARGSVTVVTGWNGDVLGDVPGMALMRAVKDQFDPGGRMAPGRLAAGV